MEKLAHIPYNPKLKEFARLNRKNPTEAEKKIWFNVLQNKRFSNLKFTRQKPLENFIADFYCAELLLVIEVDGDTHSNQKEYDELRSDTLSEKYGIHVIRYTNEEVLKNIEGVYSDLMQKIEERRKQRNPSTSQPHGISSTPLDLPNPS